MAEVPEKFPVAGELLNPVAAGIAIDPNVSLAIHDDGVFCAGPRTRDSLGRPAWDVVRFSPTLKQVAIGVEFEDGGGGDAAIGPRRHGCRTRLIGIDVPRTADHPNVIIFICDYHRNALHEPLVRQGLGPRRINFIDRWVLGSRRWTKHQS